ncbi:transcriptional regulator [Roseibium sp. TrichSKD4]|uniref:sugar-binding transcriptional regulator n=1 Tax=Roseibium sp. TrichSKD4 TaxID=744980 RepID=UPI0001E56E7A|nr:sugar-binding transcriptional regulator [Roseibium sp. TrichSKD4]EFO32017.1 transcriptional regulator [Roseibium sp. TrichSKD4]
MGLIKPEAKSDTDVAARAAWLHFIGGLTQGEVAKHLNVTNTRAHRLIARAQADGLVQIFVDVEATECVALERQLMERFGLNFCRVAMEVPETGPLPLRSLAVVGAQYLMEAASGARHKIIGIGNGRTLTASVNAMGRDPVDGKQFVSMLGGLTRSFAANPYDVIYRLAQKTGADAHLLPAPLYANSAEDKAVMMQQFGIADTMALIDKATLVVLGIGSLEPDIGSILDTATEDKDLATDLRKRGAVAELLGQFVDRDGNQISTPHDERVMAPPLDNLKDRDVVAIAAGTNKVPAVRAALQSGYLTGLLTDELTAKTLIEDPNGR